MPMDPNQVGSTTTPNQSTKRQAKEAVANVAHQAKEEISRGASKAKEKLAHGAESTAEATKNSAAGRIEGVSQALDRLADEFRQNDETWLGDQVSTLSSTVRRASDTLRRKHAREMLDDVRGLSRHPVAFLGGAFIVGLAAGRFLKSSSRSEYDYDYLGSYDSRDDLETGRVWAAPNDIYATPPSPAIPNPSSYGTTPGASTSRTVSVGGTSTPGTSPVTGGVGSGQASSGSGYGSAGNGSSSGRMR